MPLDKASDQRALVMAVLAVLTFSVYRWMMHFDVNLSTKSARSYAAELDSLAPFLRPTPRSVAVLDTQPPEPSSVSTPAPRPAVHLVRQPVHPRNDSSAAALQLSAILITDKRRVAVIDDQVVSIGSRLPGDVEVTAIEAERVVVRAHGVERVLTLGRGGS